jgi:hypothetical protein
LEWIDLYPVNPQSLASFRQTFFSSRAKDDPVDSQLLEALVRSHADRLRPYQPQPISERKLDQYCRLRRGLLDLAIGWAASPDVRDKWQTIPVVAGYPRFLWEQPDNDPIFGRVNGRRALSSTQLAPGTILFGRWSEVLICIWLGIEILVDKFSLATTAELRIRANLLVDVGFLYPLAFCASSDSGSQLRSSSR